MFPYPLDGPARGSELFIDPLVAFAIDLQLPDPELRVLRRRSIMLGASVPEAAVDEDRDLRAREHDVG
jgi:hypothetical protein